MARACSSAAVGRIPTWMPCSLPAFKHYAAGFPFRVTTADNSISIHPLPPRSRRIPASSASSLPLHVALAIASTALILFAEEHGRQRSESSREWRPAKPRGLGRSTPQPPPIPPTVNVDTDHGGLVVGSGSKRRH